MGVLGLKPERVFYYFEQISNIPRGSSNEKAVADYCVNVGGKLGLVSFSDEFNNVLIKKAGINGKENAEPVILQGHLDMVCEKNEGVKHDFSSDPIKLQVNGDDIKATGTTLGADNGIAIAIILALLEEKDASIPPLECLLTSEEEIGLIGAESFDYSAVTGKYMINLDSDEFGKVVVSCSGGISTYTSLPAKYVQTSLSDYETFSIRMRGLKGGHSGADIHLERANSNKLMGRLLDWLYGKAHFEICSISGGLKNNAIPREAQAYININTEEVSIIEDCVSQFASMVNDEYNRSENEISITISKEKKESKVFCKETARKTIEIIMAMPNGVLSKSTEIEGLVETSNNLGIITTTENEIVFTCAARSSVESRKNYVEAIIKSVSSLAGASFSSKNSYPGWRFNPDSRLRRLASQAYNEMTGGQLKIEAVHCGLECGIIKEKLGNVDIIAIGPDMWDIHTPYERLSISGVQKTYDFLIKLLEKI